MELMLKGQNLQSKIIIIAYIFGILINRYSMHIGGIEVSPLRIVTLVSFSYIFFVKKKIKIISNSEIILLLMFIFAIINIVMLEELSDIIKNTISCLLAMMVYVTVLSCVSECKKSELYNIISICGLLVSVCTLIYYLYGMYLVNFDFTRLGRVHMGGVLFENKIPRLEGAISYDPNLSAIFIYFFFFFFYYYHPNKKEKIALILCGLCSALTCSRSGILAIACGICFVKIVCYIKGKMYWHIVTTKKILCFLGIFLVIMLYLFVNTDTMLFSMIASRFKSLFNDSGSGRVGLWMYAIKGIEQNVISGIGVGMAPQYMESYRGMLFNVHNSFIEVFLEMGICGFILYVSYFWSLCVNQIKLLNKSPMSRIGLAIVIALVVSLNTISLQRSGIIYFELAFILGMVDHLPENSFYPKGTNKEDF